MNHKELIESGKLELYALGALEAKDMTEIETLLSQDAELRAEYEAIADSLTEYGKAFAEEPPISVLEKAKSEIKTMEESDINHEKVVPMSSQRPSEMYGWLSVAASLLLIASIAFNFKLRADLKEAQKQYLALESEHALMATNTVKLQKDVEHFDEMMSQISSPNVVKTNMASTANFAGYAGTIFWDKASSKVVLSAKNLPALDEKSQYQLWAIVDGKPVDAGLFTSADELKEMKLITGNAIAFAVTIEPKGGSVGPTMEKLCMIGNVAS